MGALADREWQVREEVATTLGKFGMPGGVAALIAALTDDFWQVRLRSTEALVPLLEVLGHPISNLRKEAVLALGELGEPGDRAALPRLRTAAADGDLAVQGPQVGLDLAWRASVFKASVHLHNQDRVLRLRRSDESRQQLGHARLWAMCPWPSAERHASQVISTMRRPTCVSNASSHSAMECSSF